MTKKQIETLQELWSEATSKTLMMAFSVIVDDLNEALIEYNKNPDTPEVINEVAIAVCSARMFSEYFATNEIFKDKFNESMENQFSEIRSVLNLLTSSSN